MFSLILLSGCQSTTDNQSTSTKTLKVVNLNEQELIATNSSLTMEFSENMDKSTLSTSSVYLLDSTGDKVEVTLLFVDDKHLTIEPKLFLKPLEKYKLIITTDIKSVTGLALLEQYELNFMAGYSTDSTAPKLLAFLPNYTNGVDKFTTVAMQFDEALAIDSVNNLKLTNSENNTIVSGRSIEVGSWLRLIPDDPLVVGDKYILSLTGDVMDRSRNIYTGDKNWAFVADGAVEYNGGADPLKSHIDLNTNVNSIHTHNGTIYVCGTDKLFIVGITTDKKLNLKSTIDIDADVYDIALSGDFMALATDKGIMIMSAKTNSLIKLFVTEAPVYGITYEDRYFYAAASSAGLYIFSADNGIPTQDDFKAIPIGGTAFDVASDGNYLYVAQHLDGVSKYSMSGEFIQNYTTKTATRSLNLYNNTLYVSSGVQGVSVITLGDSHISSYPTLAFAMNSIVYKDNLYVADKEREVAVFDITQNERIAHIKNFDTPPSKSSNENDIYGVSIADDMLITMSKKGTLTTYSPIEDTPLKVVELNSTVVDKEDMNVFVKFNKNIDSNSMDTIELVRTDSLGCFTHAQDSIIYPTSSSATIKYIATRTTGSNCYQAMTLDFSIKIKDSSGAELTSPNSSVHLRIEDTTPPQVFTISPIDGYDAMGEYSGDISVTFDDNDIDTSSISNTSIGLYAWKLVGSSCIASSIGNAVTYDATTKTASIDYPAPISGIHTTSPDCDGTKFEIRVDGVKDMVGNTMTTPVKSTFKAEGAY